MQLPKLSKGQLYGALLLLAVLTVIVLFRYVIL